MKVLYLTLQALPGLRLGVFPDWIDAFAKIGCDVDLVSRYTRIEDMSSDILPCKLHGYSAKRIVRVPAKLGYLVSIVDARKLVLYARRMFVKNEYDIVVVNEPNLAPSAYKYLRNTNSKTLFIAHLSTLGREKAYGFLKQKILDSINIHAISGADCVVAMTPYHKTVFEKYRTDPKSVVVIPNSVHIPPAVAERQIKPAGLKYLWVGEFSEGKDPLMAVKAALAHTNKYGKSQFTFVGEGVLLEAAKSLAKNSGHIQFLGYVNDDRRMHDIREDSDVFFFTTRHETFGRVLVESMAYGHACLASDLPVLRAVGQDSVCFYEKGNIDSLCRAMIKVEEEEEYRTSLARMARAHAVESYSPDVQRNMLRNVVASLT